MFHGEAAISASCFSNQTEKFNHLPAHNEGWRCWFCAGVMEELSRESSSHMACGPWLQRRWWPCFPGVPSLSSPTTIMNGCSGGGCISWRVQRASIPRNWPVFVPSATLHSWALCVSVRPGWIIKKARAQAVIIRGSSSMTQTLKTLGHFFFFSTFTLPLKTPSY